VKAAANIIDLIRKGSADVFGLQEVSVEWRDYLNKAFVDTGDYAAYGFGRYGGDWSSKALQSGEQFSLILYKKAKYDLVKSGHFWTSSTPDVYSARWSDGLVSKFPRSINWVMLKDKETGGEFVFVNNHLDPEDETVRVNSAALITQRMKQVADGRLCVLVGDWNTGFTKPSYAKITSNGFKDVRSIAAETTDTGTFSDWGKRDKSSWAFGDIIFASNDLAKVKKFDVLTDTYDGDYITDHCPVIAEIYYK
jgi:endonuclease/exonuclease/phosphatase family metal-dependent hydrolase